MSVQVTVKSQLLEENSGKFTADDGRNVNYHNAKFVDVADGNGIFKANIKDGAQLPALFTASNLVFDVILGEKGAKLEYVGVAKG